MSVSFPLGWNYTGEIRPGLIGSLLLHGLAAFLLFLQMSIPMPPPTAVRVVPVDMVVLARETVSPPQPVNAAAPQLPRSATPQKAPPQVSKLEPAIPNTPAPAEPSPSDTPTDALQTQLEALAKLQQAPTDPRLLDNRGASDVTASSNGAALGPQATYSVKDFVRAQVERRWNLDLDTLGEQDIVVAIRVVLKRDGTVAMADIVDKQRYNSDKIFYSIALSARNAVLLSAPFNLPAGLYDDAMDMVLNLNPKDLLR